MPSLQIRNLPDDVYRALLARAKRENRSLAQQAVVELRRVPEWIQGEARRKVVEELRSELRRRGVRALSVPPAHLVREDRDR